MTSCDHRTQSYQDNSPEIAIYAFQIICFRVAKGSQAVSWMLCCDWPQNSLLGFRFSFARFDWLREIPPNDYVLWRVGGGGDAGRGMVEESWCYCCCFASSSGSSSSLVRCPRLSGSGVVVSPGCACVQHGEQACGGSRGGPGRPVQVTGAGGLVLGHYKAQHCLPDGNYSSAEEVDLYVLSES